MLSGADLHGSVAAYGADEFLDAPIGLVLDPVTDCQGGEHNGSGLRCASSGVGVARIIPIIYRKLHDTI